MMYSRNKPTLIPFTMIIILTVAIVACKPGSDVVDQGSNWDRPNILFMIADDWSYPHAGIYGDPVVRTPTFDFLASQGILFENAYCAAPSCAPSRAAILTGKYPHQLESAGNLWSVIPSKFDNWVSILESSGYHTGKVRKGWGPGDFEKGGYKHNPAGPDFESFDVFLEQRNADQPFCFWFGSSDPHRVYETNAGVKTGMKISEVRVPGFLPDNACVRNDILDYYFEVERFDRECGQLIDKLREIGELENTLIVMTSDNGMPFPRAKANLYDYGTRMPLAIYWADQIKQSFKVTEFVNFIDFAPTMIDAAQIGKTYNFSGKSLTDLLMNGNDDDAYRQQVFLERERHANVRKGDLSYPCRAIRNDQYLLIKNFEPQRWPAGDPEVHQSVGQYGDVDNSISKFLIMNREVDDRDPDLFQLAFAKRPDLELYDIQQDPYNLINLASEEDLADIRSSLEKQLMGWMSSTGDLRSIEPNTNYWDTVLYTPTYQFGEFDLSEAIASYKRIERSGNGRMTEVACTE